MWAICFQFDSTVAGKAIKIALMIDEHARLHQMLMRKRDIFLDFAHQSEFAEMATDASDASEAALGKDVIADERERLWPKADASFFPPPGTSPTEATGYMGSGLSAAAESGLSPSKGRAD